MGDQKWENGLCECDSAGLCLASWFCTCFTFGRTKERMDHFPEDYKGELVNMDCLIYTLASCVGVPCLPVWLRRQEMRRKFGIKGDGCTDFLVTCCCACCSVSQLEGEVKKRAAKERAGAANMNTGYVRPDDKMAYQQPAHYPQHAAPVYQPQAPATTGQQPL